MQGIATIDRQQGSDTVVVWVTKRIEPLRADHTNAVTIDLATDSGAIDKIRSLVHGCTVLLTEGSVTDDLPITGEPLTVADIDALVAATEEHQQSVLDAVHSYKKRTRSAGLKDPTFPVPPKAADFTPSDGSANQRTLSTANYAARAWSAWLRTDEERRRRTARPRTGETPWIMPEDLGSLEISVIPESLTARFLEETRA